MSTFQLAAHAGSTAPLAAPKPYRRTFSQKRIVGARKDKSVSRFSLGTQFCLARESALAVNQTSCRRRAGGRNGVLVRASVASEDPKAGISLYKPRTYDVIVADAVQATVFALDDNKTRIEVEFPPLPTSISSYKGASDDFIDANIQLALSFVRKLQEKKEGLKAKLILPDLPEKRRASRVFKSSMQMMDNVSIGCLEDFSPDQNAATVKGLFGALRNVLDLDFGGEGEGPETTPEEDKASTDAADLFIIANASCTELPEVENFVENVAKGRPVVLFNLELDTLRADLGLLGFPPKSLHYRFLTTFTPAFYIRTRDYSKSVAVAPFIINYSGALLRLYPGPWQVMLKQDDGSYACVAEDSKRFTLGQTKEELLTSIGLQDEEGSAIAFLRRGYKTATWWEDELEEEKSDSWRS